MSYLEYKLISHKSKVCSLYKRALRNLESFYHDRWNFRYHAVLMRSRFDVHAKEPDMRISKKLLADGEEELRLKMHYQPLKFPFSPGGVAYKRVVHHPDIMLDMWHPLEKAQYPKYFAKREERKKEYVKWWEKRFGKPLPEDQKP